MDESSDTVVSLQDVLEEDQRLEQTANAVLGASDDSSCTYTKGYVDRQALYACATCTGAKGALQGSGEVGGEGRKGTPLGSGEVGGEGRKGTLAGICLACSLHCHEDHDLYELYTKRYFRCDCGNSKFPDLTCSLSPEKDPLNSENSYNHNFAGLYCTCSRPYPDTEDEIEDEMIQCCVCEDWFHSRHLGGGDVPDGYEEMVCDSCMASHDFLKPYKLHPPVKVGGGGEGQEVDVTSSGDSSCATHKLSTEESKLEKKSHPLQPKKTDMESSSGGSREQQSAGPTDSTAVSTSATADQPSGSGGVCELDRRRRLLLGVSGSSEEGAGYFSATWRSQLCRCHQCMSLYSSTGCLFLLEQSDSIASYEARAASLPTSHESAMTAFSTSLDRVHQVEALHQYNDMKSELVGFLQGFARDGKVVSQRDVEGFFEGMQARKRRRLETGEGVPPARCHF